MGRQKPYLQFQAHTKIRELLLKTIAQTLEFKYSLDNVIGWLFEPHVLDALRQAFPYAARTFGANSYPLGLIDVHLTIDVDKFLLRKILVPDPRAVSELVSVKALPLYEHINKIQLLRYKFAEVKYVFEYFNRYKAFSAMAYYWPVSRLLISDLKTSKRAPVIPGLSEMLPFIRETSTILAATALLPETIKDKEAQASIKMPAVKVDHMMKMYVATELRVPIC